MTRKLLNQDEILRIVDPPGSAADAMIGCLKDHGIDFHVYEAQDMKKLLHMEKMDETGKNIQK